MEWVRLSLVMCFRSQFAAVHLFSCSIITHTLLDVICASQAPREANVEDSLHSSAVKGRD